MKKETDLTKEEVPQWTLVAFVGVMHGHTNAIERTKNFFEVTHYSELSMYGGCCFKRCMYWYTGSELHIFPYRKLNNSKLKLACLFT